MTITERIFDRCFIAELDVREDVRGEMQRLDLCELDDGFVIKEQRIYKMPKKGTFFGIHFQDTALPQAKLVSVIKGRGIDYIVDLRRDSPTYKQYRFIELCGDDCTAVYIAAGFGHGFLSLEDDTIQLFSVNEYFSPKYSRVIDHKCIRLTFPFEDIIISESDKTAPFLE